MKALLALACHNIDFCMQALQKMKGAPAVAVLRLDDVIPAPTKDTYILLVPTVTAAVKNAQVLNKCPNVLVIVFDAPVLCKEIGATILDVEKQTLDYVFRYRTLEVRDVIQAVRKGLATTEPILLTKKRIDMSTKLLKRAYGSIIARFMTFIYKVPDTDKRQEIQRNVFEAWWSGDLAVMKAWLEKRYPKNPAAVDFCKELHGPDGTNFLRAVADIRVLKEAGKPINYAKISKTHKVSAYDLRYFMKARK